MADKQKLHSRIVEKQKFLWLFDLKCVILRTKVQTMKSINYRNRLRVVLAEKEITNRSLAEELKVSETTLSRWVTNKAQPSMKQFYEISKLLDVKLDDLVEPIDE